MDLRERPSTPFARHPWEVARASFFSDVVRRWSAPRPVTVLDVGAGDGYLAGRLLDALPAGSQVTCLDVNYTADHIEALTRQAAPGLRFAREHKDGDFDWLLLLDVIEHVPNDVQVLSRHVSANVRPGGRVLVSVPAWPQLFTNHDVILGHYRRYRPSQLRALAAESRLEWLQSGSLFASLLLPRSVAKLSERVRGIQSIPPSSSPGDRVETEASLWRGGALLNAALVWVLTQDARATRSLARAGIDLPGLSAWALMRRPGAARSS